MAKEFKLSAERLAELEKELNYLKTIREKEVADQIKEARSFGDLSENSEYDEAKNEQGRLYSRMAELEEILSAVSGVGEVKVLLSVESDGEKELARDTEVRYSGSTDAPEDYSRTSSAVILEGERGDESLVIRSSAPTYRGAVVVCSGGDRPEVRLAVTEAVTALTGLTSDRVAVAKWQ